MAAPTKIASAACRQSSGSLSVHLQMVRANDSEISPAARTFTTSGCAAARRTHVVCATAVPFVTRTLWISQDRGL